MWKFSKINRKSAVIYLLYVMGFLDLFAVGITVPLMSQYMKRLQTTQLMIGVVGSTFSTFQLFSGPMLGSLSDLKGRKEILIFSILCCSFAYMLMGIYNSIIVLILLRIILGLFKHTQMLTKTMLSDICSSDEQHSVYAKLTAVANLGITLGPLIGGHILEDIPNYGFTVACTTTSVLFMINGGIAYYIKRSLKDKPKKPTEKLTLKNVSGIFVNSVKLSVKDLLTVDWYNYWDIFLFKAIMAFGMSCYFSSYSSLLIKRYELTPKWIGYSICFQGLISSICSYLIKYISGLYRNDKDYSQRNLHGFMILAGSFVGLKFSPSFGAFLLCLVPLAVCSAAMRQIGLEMIIDKSVPQHRGSLIGAANSMRSIAGITAPLIAGYISDRTDVESVLYLSIFTAIIGVVVARSRISDIEPLKQKKK